MSPRTLRDIAIYTLAVAGALRLADRPDELITRAEIEAEADRWANRQPRPPMMRNTRLSRLRFTGQACLMLLAVYGLRAGEVAALRLKDFDWERESLSVPHSKSQRPRTYPLCRPVGDAVLRYLREVRPRSDRQEVFLTLRAPFRPVDREWLGAVVSRRLHALGLTLPHYGPHALRHACATHLLAQGLSLKEIGDHLGHQSPETTRIYAKVDLAGLRAVGDFNLEGLL